MSGGEGVDRKGRKGVVRVEACRAIDWRAFTASREWISEGALERRGGQGRNARVKRMEQPRRVGSVSAKGR